MSHATDDVARGEEASGVPNVQCSVTVFELLLVGLLSIVASRRQLVPRFLNWRFAELRGPECDWIVARRGG